MPAPLARVTNLDTGQTLASHAALACTFLTRLRGLQFRRPLPPGHGLLLVPCGSIHSLFVASRFDAIFIARDTRVLGVARAIRPWRPRVPAPRGTRAVLELPPGGAGQTRPGHRLALSLAGRGAPKSVSFLLIHPPVTEPRAHRDA